MTTGPRAPGAVTLPAVFRPLGRFLPPMTTVSIMVAIGYEVVRAMNEAMPTAEEMEAVSATQGPPPSMMPVTDVVPVVLVVLIFVVLIQTLQMVNR